MATGDELLELEPDAAEAGVEVEAEAAAAAAVAMVVREVKEGDD